MQNQFPQLLGVAWLLCSLFPTSYAETSTKNPQLIWNTPDGGLVDFDSSLQYQIGETIELSWDAWPYDNIINSSAVNVDLWLAAVGTATFTSRLTGTLTMRVLLNLTDYFD